MMSFLDGCALWADGGGVSAAAPLGITERSVISGSNPRTGGHTNVDMAWTVNPGATVFAIDVYATDAGTVRPKLMRRNASGLWDVLASATLSHTGGGWERATLPTPVLIAGGDPVYVGVYIVTNMTGWTSPGLSAGFADDATGVGLSAGWDGAAYPTMTVGVLY